MSRQKGFTLIELLVVIAIIGILSSVVLASLNSARKKSRDARRVSDVKQMQLALELYFDSNGGYPSTTQGLAVLATGGFVETSRGKVGIQTICIEEESSGIAAKTLSI